jgi:hypothetical protein
LAKYSLKRKEEKNSFCPGYFKAVGGMEKHILAVTWCGSASTLQPPCVTALEEGAGDDTIPGFALCHGDNIISCSDFTVKSMFWFPKASLTAVCGSVFIGYLA